MQPARLLPMLASRHAVIQEQNNVARSLWRVAVASVWHSGAGAPLGSLHIAGNTIGKTLITGPIAGQVHGGRD